LIGEVPRSGQACQPRSGQPDRRKCSEAEFPPIVLAAWRSGGGSLRLRRAVNFQITTEVSANRHPD